FHAEAEVVKQSERDDARAQSENDAALLDMNHLYFYFSTPKIFHQKT
ncbi:hypothetical protein AVEN_82940-2-1, partial [Araneus ventricosus]